MSDPQIYVPTTTQTLEPLADAAADIHLRPGPVVDAARRRFGGLETRWLVPSLSDVFFAAVLVWLFVAGVGGWSGLLADADVGWHIRTGDYILDHRSVPTADLFSFTKPGAPWFAWEWLSDVVFAEAHRWAGLKGVVLTAGLVIVLWVVLLLRQALWRGANLWPALLVTLLGAGGASMHFLARPHVFTLLFTTVAVWMIEADRRFPGKRVWLLAPFTVLWVNLHGGFMVLLLLVGLTVVGSAAEAWAGVCRWSTAGKYAAIAGACGLASLINPYGIRLHVHIVEYLRSDWIRSVVEEFHAPAFRSENQSQFEILLITGIMLAAVLIVRRRFVNALWVVVFAHLSLSSVRHAPVYIAVAAPILAQVISELWCARVGLGKPHGYATIFFEIGRDLGAGFRRTSAWLIAFVVACLFLSGPAKWPKDFPALHFPIALVRAHQDQLANGRVLTVDQWADYLIYISYPKQKVFADGRSDFYGPEIGGEYLKTMQGDYRWRRTLDQFRVDTVLAPVSWPLATLLKADPEWQVRADDGSAVLFIRSGAPPQIQISHSDSYPAFARR